MPVRPAGSDAAAGVLVPSRRANRASAAIVEFGPVAGRIAALRAAATTASSLTVDSRWPHPPASRSDCTGSPATVPGTAGGVCPPADHQGEAHGLACVDVEAAGVVGLTRRARAQQQFRAGHRIHARRRATGTVSAAPRTAPTGAWAQPRRGGPPVRRCCRPRRRWPPDPQRPATMPAAEVAAGAVGQRRQGRGLRTARSRRLDRIEGPAEQVAGHDAGCAGADVQAEGQVRLVVDLDRNARRPIAPGTARSGTLAQQFRIQQGADLAVDRGDRQPGVCCDGVAGHGPALADGGEHRRGRSLRHALEGATTWWRLRSGCTGCG